jgi:hypothetical protein
MFVPCVTIKAYFPATEKLIDEKFPSVMGEYVFLK